MINRLLRNRSRGRRGTVALEFAFVGTTFLLVLLLGAQLGFYLYAQVALDYATFYAARQLLTGVARQQQPTQASFQTATLCPTLAPLLGCQNILVNLQPVSDFSAFQSSNPLITNGAVNKASLQFNPGQATNLMLLQVVYMAPNFLWPLWSLGSGLYGSGQSVPIVSTAAFRNES